MKKLISSIIFGLTFLIAQSQYQIPYINNFDNTGDTLGWSHYVTTGVDDWECGEPDGFFLSSARSEPNAWVTNLDGYANLESVRYLETPPFDLSDPSKNYVLSFYQQRHSDNAEFYLQYSDDSGNTWWRLDNDDANKINWQTYYGWTGSLYSHFQNSKIALGFLQAPDNVIFRFKLETGNISCSGWLVDDFSIEEEYYNLYSIPGDTVYVPQTCSDLVVETEMGFDNEYDEFYNITTNYYFSYDTILDNYDQLIGTYSKYTNGNITIENTLPLPANTSVGYYYIFHTYDAFGIVYENDETDNSGYSVLSVDSVLNIPYINDFENDEMQPFKTYLSPTGEFIMWELGSGYRHHIEHTHSGLNAWHTSKTVEYNNENCVSNCNIQYIEFPSLNLTSLNKDLVLNMWYKNNIAYNSCSIEYNDNCEEYWHEWFTYPLCRDDEWDFINIPLDEVASVESIRFRIKINISHEDPEGIIIDDVFVGDIRPDLSIERNSLNLVSSTGSNTYELNYFLNNSGLASASHTKTSYYWSNDSILDDSDIYLGSKQEQTLAESERLWTTFEINKPTTSAGKYYIFYVLDTDLEVDEMREYNNAGYSVLYQQESTTLPYFNDFETQINGWRHNASLTYDDWQWTTAKGITLDSVFSGTKAWVTNDTGDVRTMSRMHLYTPLFDLSSAENPVIEFDMKLESAYIPNHNIAPANMSYSIDGGTTWIILDTVNQSYNKWYYPMEYSEWGGLDLLKTVPGSTNLLFDLYEPTFAAYYNFNSRDAERSTRYIIDIGQLAGYELVQFRFNLASGRTIQPLYEESVEGALVDNFSVRESFVDLIINHDKALTISPLSHEIKFFMNIKNKGNYFSNPSVTKYYVSHDSILDEADYYIGEENIPAIRPDINFYANVIFSAPDNFYNCNYLIYELDANNSTPELDEQNNIGSWPIDINGFNVFPYFNDFNDTVINGWTSYTINKYGFHYKNKWRFRNMLAPEEPLYFSDIKSGEMFTDRINGILNDSYVPFWYLQTPVFDFSTIDSIFMSFDLMCAGDDDYGREQGGNLEYSVDGGNFWTILTDDDLNAYNWYNENEIALLNDEPGWVVITAGWSMAYLDSTSCDLSFLRGKENIVFRFKYRSNADPHASGSIQGMRIDNFRISGDSLDYIPNDSLVPVYADFSNPDLNIDYSITNNGIVNGRITTTRMYWSCDSIFDADDILVQTITDNAIPKEDVLYSSASFVYPLPITQNVYYVFYYTDSDSTIVEYNENNNIGSFKVVFPDFVNYFANNDFDTVVVSTINPDFDLEYEIINYGSNNGSSSVTDFYWSYDNVFDAGDQELTSVAEPPITANDTLFGMTEITYPVPVTQVTNYAFYKTDAGLSINENDENDNLGSFCIIFSDVNYKADNISDSLSVLSSQQSFDVVYSITNEGVSDGTNTKTEFYWSEDEVINTSDLTILFSHEEPINAGETYSNEVNINYPKPIEQPIYYLLYRTDNENIIPETNENDNLGLFKINFDFSSVDEKGLSNIEIFVVDDKLYLRIPQSLSGKSGQLKIFDTQGSLLFTEKVSLTKGLNWYQLPPTLAVGLYVIELNIDSGSLVKKVIIY